MSFFGWRGTIERALEALQRAVRDLEAQRTTYQLERDHLLALVSAGENRMRAMLNRADKKEKNGHISGDHSDDSAQLDLIAAREKKLDLAVLHSKSRRLS